MFPSRPDFEVVDDGDIGPTVLAVRSRLDTRTYAIKRVASHDLHLFLVAARDTSKRLPRQCFSGSFNGSFNGSSFNGSIGGSFDVPGGGGPSGGGGRGSFGSVGGRGSFGRGSFTGSFTGSAAAAMSVSPGGSWCVASPPKRTLGPDGALSEEAGECYRLREALTSAQLASTDNAHIVRYHDCWLEYGELCVQSELCEPSVPAAAARAASDPRHLEHVARQLLGGLVALHEHGVAHLGIRINNVLFKVRGGKGGVGRRGGQ
jgi:hypothetical protein